MGWATVLALGEPVVGRVEDYESARGELSSLASAAEEVKAQFARVEAGAVAELQGEGAKELAALIGGVDDCLRDLPAVLSDTSGIFARHAQDLDALKRRADEALARAETRWDTWQHAERAESRAEARLASLTSQLRRTDVSGDDPGAAAAAASLASAVSSQRARVAVCRRATEAAYDELQSSRSEHESLQDDEQELVDRTVGALRGVDLRSLENPGFFDKLGGWALDAFGGILDWVADGIADFSKMVEAAMNGDFGAALWHLRDFLDKFILALAMATIVALILLSTGVGTKLAALALWLIRPTAVVASGAKAATSVYLFYTRTPHPETGELVSMADIVLDGIGALIAIAAAMTGAHGLMSGQGLLTSLPRVQIPTAIGDAVDELTTILIYAKEDQIVDALEAIAATAADAAATAWDLATDLGTEAWDIATDLGTEARHVITGIGTGASYLISDIGTGARELATDLGTEARDLATDAWDLGTDAAEATGDFATDAREAVGDFATDAWDDAWDKGTDAVEAVGDFAMDEGTDALGFVTDTPGRLADFVTGWWGSSDERADAGARDLDVDVEGFESRAEDYWRARDYLAGECGQISTLEEFRARGVSLQDSCASFQLMPR